MGWCSWCLEPAQHHLETSNIIGIKTGVGGERKRGERKEGRGRRGGGGERKEGRVREGENSGNFIFQAKLL
jgi:hypothetical protein